MAKKQKCIFCNGPTGPSSTCEKSGQKPKLITIGEGNMVNIFSPECGFKQANTWIFDTNYPISLPMQAHLLMVEGIDRFTPASPYKFFVNVGLAFNEFEVVKKIKMEYGNFCKMMQGIEYNAENTDDSKIEVEFKNGSKMSADVNDVETFCALQNLSRSGLDLEVRKDT